jgi:phosphoribosyl 1,2-cyclic phosphodiesterase
LYILSLIFKPELHPSLLEVVVFFFAIWGAYLIRTMLLSHPGSCLGYRIDHGGKSVCYVTDNEMYPPESEFHSAEYLDQLVDFVRDTDLLVTDCAYDDDEYRTRVNYGHSSVSQVDSSPGIPQLCLMHHDPDQNDAAIAAAARMQELLRFAALAIGDAPGSSPRDRA